MSPVPDEQAEPVRNESWSLTLDQIQRLFALRNKQMRKIREKMEAEQ